MCRHGFVLASRPRNAFSRWLGMFAGGFGNSGELNSAELYNAITNTWSVAGSLAIARHDLSATLLPNGCLSSAELYTAAAAAAVPLPMWTWALLPVGLLAVAWRAGHRSQRRRVSDRLACDQVEVEIDWSP